MSQQYHFKRRSKSLPITYSAKDTLETVGQVQRHNGRFDAVCKESESRLP